jgi:hypothetical protein
MKLGIHLRELSHLRISLVACLLVALAAAALSLNQLSLIPPGLKPRSLEIATAHTQVVVDNPQSTILDLRQATYDIDGLRNRAVLVGNVMASPPVRAYIARRDGVSPDVLQMTAPRTAAQPRPTAEIGRKRGSADLLRSTDQYRLDIQANPTVPILDIYAQAPNADAAGKLANASVDGLADYLRALAASERTPRNLQVTIRQLGRARGQVLNKGARLQLAIVTFIIAFGLACLAAIVIARVRRGWVVAATSEV